MEQFNVSENEYSAGTFEIAREGYWSYDASGYVALVRDGKAALIHVSRCSCYGTWEQKDGPPWDWVGTVDELVEMAKSEGDPDMPGRKASQKDYGFSDLLAVYKKIVAWDAMGRK